MIKKIKTEHCVLFIILSVVIPAFMLFYTNDSYAEDITLYKISETVDGNTTTSVFSNVKEPKKNFSPLELDLFTYKLSITTSKYKKGRVYGVKTRVKMVELQNLIGAVPKTSLNLYLQAKETGGSWKTIEKRTRINLKEGKTASTSSLAHNTKWWRGKVTGKIGSYRIMGSVTRPYIRNTKATIYPRYSLPKTPLYLKKQSTKMKIVSPANRVAWSSNKRYKYIKWFKKNYAVGKKMDWGKYEIHHMKPREYGGTNKYSNLIPLPRSFHQNKVNTWWNAY